MSNKLIKRKNKKLTRKEKFHLFGKKLVDHLLSEVPGAGVRHKTYLWLYLFIAAVIYGVCFGLN